MTRASLADAETGEQYAEAASLDAELQAILAKLAEKEKRVQEIGEELEKQGREAAVLKSKDTSVRRKALLKLIELQRRREDFSSHCSKERDEYTREREQHILRRVEQLERSQSGMQSDIQMLVDNRDSIKSIVERATGGLKTDREQLRERLGEVEREIRELERQLREKNKIKAQVAEKIAKIDSSVRDVRARYDGELGELEAQLRDKELRVAELDVERTAVERVKREYKDNVVAFDTRINQQKQGLQVLQGTIRGIEGEISRGMRIAASRDEDRDKLHVIEASLDEEGDVTREVRVRLEEYDFEIHEAQKRLDDIAGRLAEKRAEEEDLRVNKVVRAEQDKKQAAQERNYKEAQRLRDLVAKMKEQCVELEGDIDELEVQRKEHLQRVDDSQKASVEEREKLASLSKERDSTRLNGVERKLGLFVSIRERMSQELKDVMGTLREAADQESTGKEDAKKLNIAEADRKLLAADLALVELQIDESFSECVLLANRCEQTSRVDSLRELLDGSSVQLSATPITITKATQIAEPSSAPASASVSEDESKEGELEDENDADKSLEEEDDPVTPVKDEEEEEEQQSPALSGRSKDAMEAELLQVTEEWETALEEEDYETAETLDLKMTRLKTEIESL